MYKSKLILKIVEAYRINYIQLETASIIEDLELSIESLGVNVLHSDLKDLEQQGQQPVSFVRVNKKTMLPEIVLNGNESMVNKREALAHELGHITLHWKWLPKRKIRSKLAEITFKEQLMHPKSQRDHEATIFAMELLMPLKDVKNMYKATRNETVLKHILAEKYKVGLVFSSNQINTALKGEL